MGVFFTVLAIVYGGGELLSFPDLSTSANSASTFARRHAARVWSAQTIYNRFVRWSRLGVFNKIFAALAHKAQARASDDRRHASEGASHRRKPFKKGLFPDVSGAPKAA